MIRKIFILLLVSFISANINSFLLKELYDNRTSWEHYDQINQVKNIFIGTGINDGIVFIKIEQKVDLDNAELFSTLKDIESYNDIVSNENIFTNLIKVDSDTIYAHQLITNVIPLVRNRQYVFKMYSYNELRLDWILLDSSNPLMQSYIGKNTHDLIYGAGSWHLSDKNILSYRMYIDDDVNIFPERFIRKIRINSAIDIFDDVLGSLKLNRGNN